MLHSGALMGLSIRHTVRKNILQFLTVQFRGIGYFFYTFLVRGLQMSLTFVGSSVVPLLPF